MRFFVMMKLTLLLALAFGIVALVAPTTHACFCVTGEVPEALNRAMAVFLGEVIDISEPRTSDEIAPLADRFFKIKFKVERSWKGVAFGSQEITVLSAQGRYGCFAYPPVRKGEKYLVYADPAFGGNGWSIITICNRTTIVRPPTAKHWNLLGQDSIDPYDDMKRLDGITKRTFNFDLNRSRNSKRAARVGW